MSSNPWLPIPAHLAVRLTVQLMGRPAPGLVEGKVQPKARDSILKKSRAYLGRLAAAGEVVMNPASLA